MSTCNETVLEKLPPLDFIMLFMYVYIIPLLDADSYGFVDNNRTYNLDIYASSYEYPRDSDTTTVHVELPWEQATGRHERSFVLSDETGRDWHGSFIITPQELGGMKEDGLRLKSTGRLSVQVITSGSNTERRQTYSALPLTDKAREFYVNTANASSNLNGNGSIPLFLVATGDRNTRVTIYSWTGHKVLSSILHKNTVRNFFWTYAGLQHGAVYRVASTKAVALYRISRECYGLGVEGQTCQTNMYQVPPVHVLRSQHVIGPVSGVLGNSGVIIRVLFTADKTRMQILYNPDQNNIDLLYNDNLQCNVSKNTLVANILNINCNITAGTFLDLKSTNCSSPFLVRTTRPSLVTMTIQSENPSHGFTRAPVVLVPPAGLHDNQARFNAAAVGNSSVGHYVTMVIPNKLPTRLLLDGVAVNDGNSSLRPIVLGDYNVISVEIETGVHEITLEGEKHDGVSVEIYGYNSSDITNWYSIPVAYMDKDSMGILPPGDPMLSKGVMVALLATMVSFMAILYLTAFVGSSILGCIRRNAARTCYEEI